MSYQRRILKISSNRFQSSMHSISYRSEEVMLAFFILLFHPIVTQPYRDIIDTHKLTACVCRFDVLISCKMIMTITLANTCIISVSYHIIIISFSVVRTFTIYSLGIYCDLLKYVVLARFPLV